MDEKDMRVINDIYLKILRNGRHMYGAENTIDTAHQLENYSTYLSEMNGRLESMVDLTQKFSVECLSKATEIREAIYLDDKFAGDQSKISVAFRDKNSNLSWADMTEIEDRTDVVLECVKEALDAKPKDCEFKQKNVLYKVLTNIYGIELDHEWKLPIANRIKDIPSAMQWYKGDTNNPEGVYICLSDGFYAQVPMPNILDATKDFSRTGSVKCKHYTKEACYKARESLACRRNFDMRNCPFAHQGDKYVKIGTVFRCPKFPGFGKHSSLNADLVEVPDDDMRSILMYALSDAMLGSLWFQNQKQKNGIVMTNIDIC
jgi:uncharacterized protein with HEPN domain